MAREATRFLLLIFFLNTCHYLISSKIIFVACTRAELQMKNSKHFDSNIYRNVVMSYFIFTFLSGSDKKSQTYVFELNNKYYSIADKAFFFLEKTIEKKANICWNSNVIYVNSNKKTSQQIGMCRWIDIFSRYFCKRFCFRFNQPSSHLHEAKTS